MEITYVTGNWAKVKAARQILEPLGLLIDNIKIEVPELQNDSIEEIAKYSAKWASDKLKSDILKSDSGLCIEALNGFPGPYTHYVEDTLGEDAILKLMANVENRKAYFIEVLAYCRYREEPVLFTSITPGTIAKEKSGQYGWSWDFIFIPNTTDKTLGCFKDEERFNFWNNDAYIDLANYVKNLVIEHKMHLNPDPFNLIKAGTKTIELRVLDEKRRKMKVSDLIEFENCITKEKINARISNLYKYSNFEELYKHFDKISMGYKDDEEASFQDMDKYYSREEQEKFGVVAIELEVIDKE